MNSSDSTTEGSENSSSEQSEKMVHSRTPAPSHAKTPIPPPHPSDSESEDDSDFSTPPLKKPHEQEQKKEQQPQKQKDLLPPPSPSAPISNKTAAAKTSVKRPREVEYGETLELPSTKKKATARTVQHSDNVSAKETKKAHKRKVTENVSTPSSPQKSGKKGLHVWNLKDELAFLNGLLAFTKEGNELPKNMSPVYDYVRNTMDIQYSNKQFRDKLRRLKTKFQALVENMEVNNYSFKSPDEAAMYKISKQLWGVEDEGDDGHRHNAETVSRASMKGKEEKKKKKQLVQAEEEDGEKIKDGDQGEEEEGEDEPKRDKTMTNALVRSNAGDVERIREERDNMVNGMKNTVTNILKESEAKKKAMIEGYLLNNRADHVQSPFNDLMTGIYSGRRAPVLNKVKAEALEEKWRKQQIVEMKAFLGRLDLLQEECDMYLEGLREPVGRGRS